MYRGEMQLHSVANARPLGRLERDIRAEMIPPPLFQEGWINLNLMTDRLNCEKNKRQNLAGRRSDSIDWSQQENLALLPFFSTSSTTAPSASRMTRILLVALSVAGRRAKQPTGAQREPPWRQKFKLPPLRAERRRCLALVWENYGTRPTRYSRHPGDIPVGLDP